MLILVKINFILRATEKYHLYSTYNGTINPTVVMVSFNAYSSENKYFGNDFSKPVI